MARVWARAAAVGVRLGEAYRSPTDGRRFKPFVGDGERHTVDSRSSWIGESFSDPMVEVMVEEVVRAEKVQEDEFLFEADQLLKDSAWDQLLELYLPERAQQVTGGATESLCCHKASTCNDNTKERNYPFPPKGCSRQDQSGDSVCFV